MSALAWVNTHQGTSVFLPLSAFFPLLFFFFFGKFPLLTLNDFFNTGSRLLEDINLWVTRKANYART